MTTLLIDANNVMLRCCTTCGEEKSTTEFYKHSARKDGLQSECKVCHKARALRHAQANPEMTQARLKRYRDRLNPEVAAERIRRRNYKVAYGITVEEYDEMLVTQGGKCAICSADEPGGPGRWHVDHDHKTSKVRGLLCARCNRALGGFKDDPVILQSAIDYLRRAV